MKYHRFDVMLSVERRNRRERNKGVPGSGDGS